MGSLERALVAFLLTLLGHALFVGLVVLFSLLHFGPGRESRPKAKPVALRALTPAQWATNRGAKAPLDGPSLAQRQAPKVLKEPEKKKDEPEAVPEGQIVDVGPGNREKSEDAQFLAESDNRAEKETKAKNQTAYYRNAMPKHTSTAPKEGQGRDSVEVAQLAGNEGLGKDDRPLREQSRSKSVFEIPDTKRRQEVALKLPNDPLGAGAAVSNRTESEAVVGNSNRLRVQQGSSAGDDEEASEGKAGKMGVANLTPSMAVLDKISGAPANDHLKDVDEGEGTYLNTKEWKYSSFFNRVKQSVGMHWSPGSELRRRDATGNIYGGRDRYTVLNVTLNEKGMVKDVYVEKSCGLDFLDLEAIHSFERAQPFPNPPPGLMSADSTLRFSFGFFLDMGGGPRMRLFRRAD